MKKILTITIFVMLILLTLSGCGTLKTTQAVSPTDPETPPPVTASNSRDDLSGISVGPPVTENYDPGQSQAKIEMVYVNSDSGTNYHRLGCKSLNSGEIALGLDEAKEEGYTPCPFCQPPQ